MGGPARKGRRHVQDAQEHEHHEPAHGCPVQSAFQQGPPDIAPPEGLTRDTPAVERYESYQERGLQEPDAPRPSTLERLQEGRDHVHAVVDTGDLGSGMVDDGQWRKVENLRPNRGFGGSIRRKTLSPLFRETLHESFLPALT